MPDPPPLVPLATGTLVFFYVIVPLLVVVHELGHALAAIRANRRPTVRVGVAPPVVSWRLRRLDVHLNPRLPLDYFYPRTPFRDLPKTYLGECEFDPTGLTVGQLRAILSAGPHASILAGLAFGLAAWFLPAGSLSFWLAAATACFALVEGLGNLLPREHEGRLFSDGAVMMRLRRFPADLVVPGQRRDQPLPVQHADKVVSPPAAGSPPSG